jgi:hypothetical protein
MLPNGAADNPPAPGHEGRPQGGLDGRRWTGSSACYGAERSEGAITSGWPERSGGIRRAVMATSEAVAITASSYAARRKRVTPPPLYAWLAGRTSTT